MFEKFLPYKIKTAEIPVGSLEWCLENIGSRWSIGEERKKGTWSCIWLGNTGDRMYLWQFKNEQDATWFTLRWA